MLTPAQYIRQNIETARSTFNDMLAKAEGFLDECAGIINIWQTPTVIIGEDYVDITWYHNQNYIELDMEVDGTIMYLNLDEWTKLPFDKDVFVANMHKMYGGNTA